MNTIRRRKLKIKHPNYLKTALACTSEGFAVGPDNLLRFGMGNGKCMTNDPKEAEVWWTGSYKTLGVLLPVGSTFSVIAVQIAKTHGNQKHNGFPAVFRLQRQHGALPATSFFEDGRCWTLLYAAPENFVLNGVVEIAPGITVSGDGEWIHLPPYYCPVNRATLVEWPSAYKLTRANLKPAPEWLIQKACGLNLLKILAEWREADQALQTFDIAA